MVRATRKTRIDLAAAGLKEGAGLMQPGQRYFVRWRGALTTSGEIGPQGPGVPAVCVRELTEVREASLADCASATPAR